MANSTAQGEGYHEEEATSLRPTRFGDHVMAYDVLHVVNALRVGCMTHNLGQVLSQTKASLRLVFGGQQGSGDGVDGLANHIKVPSRWTLQKAVKRLDVATMLLQRHVSGQQGPISRYLAYDASPQGGVEIFCAAERVVNMRELHHAFPHRPSVITRFLPLTTLGVGRMGQADKAQALIHQTWLEYGPSAAAVRQANVCVRQCLTDMGVEANVVDLPDLVNQAAPSVTVGAPMAANKYLFPLALSIPGGQRILDNALQTALAAAKWWPEWQRLASSSCSGWLRQADAIS